MTGQSKSLNITIAKRHLVLKGKDAYPSIDADKLSTKTDVWKQLSQKSTLSSYHIVVLMGNEDGVKNNRAIVYFSETNAKKGKALYDGTYTFEKEGKTDYLVLKSSKRTYKYIIGGFGLTENAVKGFLNSDKTSWDSSILNNTLTLKEDFTDDFLTKYPDLTSALWVIKMNVSASESCIPTWLIK